MTDSRGYRIIVKLNLPPQANYHSGHSLIIQGDSVDEIRDMLNELAGRNSSGEEFDERLLNAFVSFAEDAGKLVAGRTNEWD